MVGSIVFTESDGRKSVYAELLPQIAAVTEGESDVTANLANISAILKQAFDFFWVGFYLQKEGQLVLGPFQGPLACTRIDFDKGVCGHAYTTRETVIVPDVDAFPGHIACASASKSEIVVPIFNADGSVYGVLDVDSDSYDDFGQVDADGLAEIMKIVEKIIEKEQFCI